MDLSTVIPLLIKDKNLGEREKMMFNMLTKKDNTPPDIGQLMAMMQNSGTQKKAATQKDNSFDIVKIIAPSDILGKILKYFLQKP